VDATTRLRPGLWRAGCIAKGTRPVRREAAGDRRPKGNTAPVAYFYRTVKYEEVYLKDYATVREAIRGLSDFFRRYNVERPHAALGDRTPYEVYHGVTAPYPSLQIEEGIHLKRAS
jgi:transposase InsO family protein